MAIKKQYWYRGSSWIQVPFEHHRLAWLLFLTFLIFTGLACSPKPPAPASPKLPKTAPPSKAAIEEAAQSGIPVEQPQPKLVAAPPWLYTKLYPSGSYNLPRVVKHDIEKPIGQYPYIQPIVDKFIGLTMGPKDGLDIGIDNLAREGEYFITGGDQLWTSPGRLYQVRFSKEVRSDAYIALHYWLLSLGAEQVLGSARATFENHQVPLEHRPQWCRTHTCESVIVYALKWADVQVWFQWASAPDEDGTMSVMQFGELPASFAAPFQPR